MENTTLENYEAPWDVETLKKKGLERLLKTPWHLWRAETGIELIHKEPTIDEFFRIWNNWQKMSSEMKKKSDEKSKELFGMTNKEHFEALLKEYNKDTPKQKISRKCPFCFKLHEMEIDKEETFSTLTPYQRTFIKTGVCKKCYGIAYHISEERI